MKEKFDNLIANTIMTCIILVGLVTVSIPFLAVIVGFLDCFH